MSASTQSSSVHSMDTTLSDRLKKARKHAGLTQVQLAEKSGTTQQTISNIERGIQDGSGELVSIAIACGVRAEWLEQKHGSMILAYSTTDPRMGNTMKVLESLPPDAQAYFIQNVDETAEFIKTLIDNSNKKAG